MLKQTLITYKIYFSVVPFVLIRKPDEDYENSSYIQKFDILDQTRIHHEHYKLAMKIATDACMNSEMMDSKDIDNKPE